MNSKSDTIDAEIRELASELQCHSHGYMCEDCPQPEEDEIVKRLKSLLLRERQNETKTLNLIGEVVSAGVHGGNRANRLLKVAEIVDERLAELSRLSGEEGNEMDAKEILASAMAA